MKTEDLEAVLNNFNILTASEYSETQRLVALDIHKRVLGGGLLMRIELKNPVITQSRTRILGTSVNIESSFTFRPRSSVTIPFQTNLSVNILIARFKCLFRIIDSNPIFVFERTKRGSSVFYRRLYDDELPFGAYINWVLQKDKTKTYVFRDEYPEIHQYMSLNKKELKVQLTQIQREEQKALDEIYRKYKKQKKIIKEKMRIKDSRSVHTLNKRIYSFMKLRKNKDY